MNAVNFALKEWQVVNDAILEGKHTILIRKGGILDTTYDFPPDKRMFFIFPTYEHQKKEYVRENFHYLFKEQKKEYKINTLCELMACIQITNSKQLEILEPYVIYTKEFLNARFNYRAKDPLYALFIKSSKLLSEISIEYTDYMHGCKSWIELKLQNLQIKDIAPITLGFYEKIDKLVNLINSSSN